MSAPRMVRVEWIDSGMNRSDGWEPASRYAEELGKPTILSVTTVGMLMHEDGDHIIVGQSYDPHNDHWYSGQVIYRPCIQKIDDLAVSTPAYAGHTRGHDGCDHFVGYFVCS